MTAKLQAEPINLLSEDFEFSGHPADLEQLVNNGIETYEAMPKSEKTRKQYRTVLNKLIDRLYEMRGFKQFNYVT